MSDNKRDSLYCGVISIDPETSKYPSTLVFKWTKFFPAKAKIQIPDSGIWILGAAKETRCRCARDTSYGVDQNRYRNILLVFPTIALLNENTDSMKDLIRALGSEYKIINNVYSSIDENEKHIFQISKI